MDIGNPRARRATLFKMLSVVFWCVPVAVLGAEIVCRWGGAYPRSGVVFDERLGWRHQPNLRTTSTRADGRQITVTTNASGFRGHPLDGKKQPGVVRILVLGDSYTAGMDCSDADIYTARLEALLNEGTTRYEVLSAAASAWAIDQELIFLRDEGIATAPDIVVLMMAPNDIREADAKRFFLLEQGQLIERGVLRPPWPERTSWALANSSSLFQWWQTKHRTQHGEFQQIFRYFPVVNGYGDSELFFEPTIPPVRDAMALYEALLDQVLALCRTHGAQLILGVVPTRDEVQRRNSRVIPGRIAEYVDALAVQRGIAAVNLYQSLRQRADPIGIYLPWEYHFSEVGQAFVAEQLAAAIRNSH